MIEWARPNLVVPDQWLDAPAAPTAEPREVQVWRVDLPATAAEEEWAVLSEDELETAERCKFEIERNRYVACRAQLRRILGGYIDVPPGRVSLAYGDEGKPFISHGEQRGIQFNVSHSGDCALIAVGMGGEVGVDVERMRADIDFSALTERFFTAGERAFISALDPARQREGFYRCWTRKEAWMKAIGTGLAGRLDLNDVSVSLSGSSTIMRDCDGVRRWGMIELRPEVGTVGALVMEPMVERVRLWRIAR